MSWKGVLAIVVIVVLIMLVPAALGQAIGQFFSGLATIWEQWS